MYAHNSTYLAPLRYVETYVVENLEINFDNEPWVKIMEKEGVGKHWPHIWHGLINVVSPFSHYN